MREWLRVQRKPEWRPERLRERLGIGAGVAVLLALLGPFGTFSELTLTGRLLYWSLAIVTGYALFETLLTLAADQIPRRWLWPGLGAALLLASALETAVVVVLEHSLIGRSPAAAGGLLTLYGYVVLLGTVITALPLWLRLRATGVPFAFSAPQTPASDENPVPENSGPENPAEAGIPAPAASAPSAPARADWPGSPFLRRIPARLGQDLLALEMEDHYIRIHTSLGSDLLLMRLRDAVEELATVPGLLVHRSYWVTAAAVLRVEREAGGRLTLILRNGLRVPVSRRRAIAVRAAGWEEPGPGMSGSS